MERAGGSWPHRIWQSNLKILIMERLVMQKFQYRKIIPSSCHILMVILFLTIIPAKTYAGTEEISTSEVKASWIYTIIEWLDWKNPSKNGKFTICAVGRDKVYMHLKRMEAKFAHKNNHKFSDKFSVQNKSTIDDFKECNILYISESEQEYYMNMLDAINGAPGVIAISSIGGFARHGGSIEFVIKKKARLVINLKVIKNAKVAVDDELFGWVETIN